MRPQQVRRVLTWSKLILTIGLVAAVAAAAIIVGERGKIQALAACDQETLRFYSDLSGDDFLIACMEARGYRFDVTSTDCNSRGRMSKQAACYATIR